MARLTYVYRAEDISYVKIGRRQLPVVAGDNLMMLMDLNTKGLSIDGPQIRGKELEEFSRKFHLLSSDELRESLEIDSTNFLAVLNQCVQCVGCRRSVERLFYQLTLSEHPTVDPLVLKTSCLLSIAEEKLKSPQALGTILYRHHEILNNLLENKLRNKTRCVLHSLDTFRTKPFSETWREVWSTMKNNCRDELAVIETKELHDTLDTYLKKHKFCQGCRTKIEKAYNILVGETTTKEKGYVAALYANIKKCHPDKHIHVATNKIDFLGALMRRAEPEVNGSFTKQRERHAKTLEIAQEEVLTCVGMIMYERLRRIYVSLREEERACQVLAAVGVHALCRSFDISVEKKQGISNLELLYQEISRAERAKQHKREQKKLKKKKKKDDKKNNFHSCDVDAYNTGSDTAEADCELDNVATTPESEEEHFFVASMKDKVLPSVDKKCDEEPEVVDLSGFITPKSPKRAKQKLKQLQKSTNKKKGKRLVEGNNFISKSFDDESPTVEANEPDNKCVDCQEPSLNCPCEIDMCTQLFDAGYSTDHNSHLNSRTSSVVSSSEGSEVSCSEGFCNHEPSNVVHELHEAVTEHQNLDECGHREQSDCEEYSALCCSQSRHSLSLLQMLRDFDDSNDDDVNCYIPPEVVLQYHNQHEKVQQQRLQLRETLKQNFARLCMQRAWPQKNCK